MPIVYVNPSGSRRASAKGSAKVGKLRRRRARRARANPARKKKIMARAKRNKMGRFTKRKGRKGARKGGARKGRRKGRKVAAAAPKRRRKKRAATKRRRGRRTAAKLGHRRKRRYAKISKAYAPRYSQRGRAMSSGESLKLNPAKKRRKKSRRGRATAAKLGWRRRRKGGAAAAPKKRRRARRRGRRTAARLGARRRKRYGTRRARSIARRARRKYRRNGAKDILTSLKQMARAAAPVVISIIGTKLLTSKLSPRIPGLSRLGRFQGPAVAVGVGVLAHFATRHRLVSKYRGAIMMGVGIVAIQETLTALLPDSVKSMIGMGDIYGAALNEYVPVQDYVGDGDGLNDYVSLNDYEQEMGNSSGSEFTSELGAWDTRQSLPAAPARSFVEDEDQADAYAGIFGGTRI